MKTVLAPTEVTCATHHIYLTREQTFGLFEALKTISPPAPSNYADFFIRAKEGCAQILTHKQRAALASLANSGSEPALVLHGLPVAFEDDLDPSSGSRPNGLPWSVDAVQTGIVAQIGYLIGYPDEYGAAKIHEIAPANHAIATPKKSQLRTALAVHSDRARFPDLAQCDILTLLGLRNPERVATQFAPVSEVLQRVPERLRPVLFEPRFDFTKNGQFAGYRPILRMIDGEIIVCLPPEDLPCDSEAREAQDAFRGAVVEGGTVVERGMMLLIRNRTCLHWRSAIDSPKRWLRRAYCIAPSKYEKLLAQNLIDPRTFALAELQ